MLAVDIKDFGGRRGVDHEALTAAIPDILNDALCRGDLGHLVDADRFDQASGDGWLRGYDPTLTPFLLNPFLMALENELTDRNHRGAHRSGAGQPLRMRVSVNLGPVTDSGRNQASDGSGAARVATHRLLDAAPVRALLERSDPSATHVAAIISARVYEDAVLTGYAAMPDSLFHRVPVEVKTYRDIAYLHVPRTSGRLLAEGFGSAPYEPANPQAFPRPDRGDGSPGGPTAGSSRAGRTGAPRDVRVGGVGNVGSASTVFGGDNHGSLTSGPHLAGPVGAYVAGSTVRDVTSGNTVAGSIYEGDTQPAREARDVGGAHAAESQDTTRGANGHEENSQ
ncbi:hypothetical protein [Pseudofrankia sp. BMG5.36]|uniref:hypothetical protein n=1 Tax=Pseudofrankia sp. BMG5.36 TaxID=1834512 RepID=UPI001041BDFD|nr:hypothetical protein [Pseudofrankia sp. BMG5.36]